MDLQTEEKTSADTSALAAGRAEARLLREVASANLRIRQLEAQLAGQAEARAELVNLVCHELRTPISVISGFSRLLQNEVQGALSKEQHRFLKETLKACRRLDLFVGDLLEVRADAETPFMVVATEGNLHETIEGQLESLAPLLEERGIKVDASLCFPDRTIRFDARRIEQVITNLMTNAVRYGRASGVIRLGTRACDAISGTASPSGCEVWVEDDGPGIPEADRERLFAPYVRGELSGESGNDIAGLGIGLAISRRIVEAHGGRIWVEEGDVGGARFVFNLPRTGCAGGEV